MPMTEWWFREKSEPRTDKMTIAKHDITVQLQALKADTTGFMVGELQGFSEEQAQESDRAGPRSHSDGKL